MQNQESKLLYTVEGELDLLPFPVMKVKEDGKIIYANRRIRNKLCIEPDAESGLSILQLLYTENPGDMFNHFRLLREGILDEFTMEFEMIREQSQFKKLFVHFSSCTHNLSECVFIATLQTDRYAVQLEEENSTLKKNLEFALTMLDNLPADIAIMDKNKNYAYINKAALPDDKIRSWLVGKSNYDYTRLRGKSDDYAIHRERSMDHCFQMKTPIQFEEVFQKDGKEVTKLRVMHPVLDENNEVEYILGYGIDISSLKESEKMIYLLKTGIEKAYDGFALCDADGNYYYMNDAHVKIFGYETFDELNGKSWKTLYPDFEVKRLEQTAFPILSQNGSWSGRTEGISKQGKQIFQEISLATLPNGGLICVCRDSTEKAKNELEIKKLASVADKTNSVVVITDNKARIEWTNKAFEKVTGFSLEDVRGLNPMMILSGPETDRSVLESIKNAVNKGNSFTGQIQNYRKDGTSYWTHLDITPIFDNDNKIVNFVVLSSDVSHLKEAEFSLKKTLQKEKELNALKSRFVSLISHEFRTPLADIQLSVDILRLYSENSVDEPLMAKLYKQYNKIESEVDHMTNLMNNVLTLGRMESNRLTFKPVWTDLIGMIEDQGSKIRLNETDGRIVEFNVIGERRDVYIDPGLMTHIINNLISNAFKYSPGSSNPELSIRFNDDSFTILVKDYGIGIPKSEKNYLFQSFFRATNTENIPGTGLGLVIVKQFVELHKGKIRIESTTNKGTTVEINIPIKHSED